MSQRLPKLKLASYVVLVFVAFIAAGSFFWLNSRQNVEGRWVARMQILGRPTTIQFEVVLREAAKGRVTGFGTLSLKDVDPLPVSVEGFRTGKNVALHFAALDKAPAGLFIGAINGEMMRGRFAWAISSVPGFDVRFRRAK